MKLRFPRFTDIDRLLRRPRLERKLTRLLPPGTGFRRVVLVSQHVSEVPWRFQLYKDGTRIVLGFDHWRILSSDHLFWTYETRAAVLVQLFARTGAAVRSAAADISDGWPRGRGTTGFCSADPDAILIPDSEFWGTAGYGDFREPAMSRRPWAEREEGLVWRGSTTGKGLITTEELQSDDPRLIQRTRLCLAMREVPGADLKLTRVVQSQDEATDRTRLAAAGILGETLPAESWGHRKFALDIDGNSNAWTNLFTRLLLGCCVLKVGSLQGYRQWYYDELRPYQHFVPVAPDHSDLVQQIEWCRTHDQDCEAIAAAGAAFALERTLEREMNRGVDRLNQRLSG